MDGLTHAKQLLNLLCIVLITDVGFFNLHRHECPGAPVNVLIRRRRTVLIPANEMKGKRVWAHSPATGIEPAQVPLAPMTSALTTELPRCLVKNQNIIAEW